MKQRKNGLHDQSVYHELIQTEKAGRKWIAFTRYWIGYSEQRIDVQRSGDTEQEALKKLNQFLNSKEPNKPDVLTHLQHGDYSLITGEQRNKLKSVLTKYFTHANKSRQ